MKATGKIYAMKVMSKKQIEEYFMEEFLSLYRRRQYEHILAERRIMEGITHPFLVWYVLSLRIHSSLKYAFQSQTKLYIVMDFFNGGELYHYLSKGRFSEVDIHTPFHFLEKSKVLCCRNMLRYCSLT